MSGRPRPHPWPAHLAWVIAPAAGPQAELAQADDDVTCLYQWPSGTRLAEYLSTHLATLAPCRDRRVADLGCGRGGLGLTAFAAGASAVLFADASPVAVEFLTRTIAMNALNEPSPHMPRAHVVQHHWGTALPGAPYDLILGGDILYRPECFADLMTTIAGSLSRQGCALLSDPRTVLEPQLTDLAAKNRLTLTTHRIEQTTVIHLVGC